MNKNRILLPVCGNLYPYRLDHKFFWLARHLPARLFLVEVILPSGCIRSVLNWFRDKDRAWRLSKVETQVLDQDKLKCRTGTVIVPNLTIGITEAAWQVKANFVALTPELQQMLGKMGLRDLNTRLGEMGRCMLVLFGKGPTIHLEPCTIGSSKDRGQIIRIRRLLFLNCDDTAKHASESPRLYDTPNDR